MSGLDLVNGRGGSGVGSAVATPLLALRGVSVVRGGRTLLRDVDWTVSDGERWVVLGPNGAGKTTLLEVAAAAVRPATGTVELLGEAVDEADLDLLLGRVGWCSPALGDRLPGRERVLDTVLCATVAGLARGAERYEPVDERRAMALLAQLGCAAFANRRYASLSSGERQQVQIARALMPDPEIMLLDEPGAGLDLAGREALLRRLSRLAADPQAPATVLVTHHVEDIPVGMTHALLLRAGVVVAAGPAEEVLEPSGLSACFGLPLAVDRRGGRYTARALLGRSR